MGCVATVFNALAVTQPLDQMGIETRVPSRHVGRGEMFAAPFMHCGRMRIQGTFNSDPYMSIGFRLPGRRK